MAGGVHPWPKTKSYLRCFEECFVGVPTRGRVNHNTVLRLLDLQARFPDVTYHVEASGISVGHTKNTVVKRFLETDKQIMFMLDDDVIPRMTVFDLAESKFDILGGTYFIIQTAWSLPHPGVFEWSEEKRAYVPLKDVFGKRGRVPCDAIVSGCLAVKRHVLEHPEMRGPFACRYNEDGTCEWSDDISFCDRARKLGFTIGADFDQHCDHLPDGASLNWQHERYLQAFLKMQQKPLIVQP